MAKIDSKLYFAYTYTSNRRNGVLRRATGYDIGYAATP